MSEHLLLQFMIKDRVELFREAKTKEAISLALGFDYSYFLYLIYSGDIERHYTEFNISKKNGKQRVIAAPNNRLKLLQKRLANILVEIYRPKRAVHAFTSEKSIVTNARPHLRKKNILKIDLENFFPSIHFGRVRNFFQTVFQFPQDVATTLARICCYKGALPQGAPTSPILSNMICLRLDGQLNRLAHDCRCSYTRYADDITFSTNEDIFSTSILASDSPVRLSQKMIDIIETNNFFKINHYKTRIMKNNDSKYIAGVKVNEKLNISRKKYREVRAIIHAIQKFGPELALKEHLDKYDKRSISHKRKDIFRILDGKISFLNMVRGENDSVVSKLRLDVIFLKEIYKKRVIYSKLDIPQSIILSNYTIIITEGKTDRAYLSLALRLLQRKGLFNNLKLLFYAFPQTSGSTAIIDDLGSIKSKGVFEHCQNYKKIYILDRDVRGIKNYFVSKSEKEYPKFWGNNTWSFALPIPSFRQEAKDDISIEHFLFDERIFSKDKDGHRLYFWNEFEEHNDEMRHKKNHNITTRKRKVGQYTLIEEGVVLDKKNIARPKADVASEIFKSGYIEEESLNEFAKLFEIIEKIIA